MSGRIITTDGVRFALSYLVGIVMSFAIPMVDSSTAYLLVRELEEPLFFLILTLLLTA
jgi:hypothetical protein